MRTNPRAGDTIEFHVIILSLRTTAFHSFNSFKTVKTRLRKITKYL